jgi:hypothetical protein
MNRPRKRDPIAFINRRNDPILGSSSLRVLGLERQANTARSQHNDGTTTAEIHQGPRQHGFRITQSSCALRFASHPEAQSNQLKVN